MILHQQQHHSKAAIIAKVICYYLLLVVVVVVQHHHHHHQLIVPIKGIIFHNQNKNTNNNNTNSNNMGTGNVHNENPSLLPKVKSSSTMFHRLLKNELIRLFNKTESLHDSLSLSSSSLVEWLDEIHIPIPNISYTTTNHDTVVSLTINIYNFSCTQFTIQHIQTIVSRRNTTVVSNNNNNNDRQQQQQPSSITQLQLMIQNISTTCIGQYHIVPLNIDGTITIALGMIPMVSSTEYNNNNDIYMDMDPILQSIIATTTTTPSNETIVQPPLYNNNNNNMDINSNNNNDNNAFEWTVDILDKDVDGIHNNDDDNNNNTNNNNGTTTTSIRQPNSIRSTACTINSQVLQLQFTGTGSSSTIMNIFRSLIRTNINQYIQQKVCPTYITNHNVVDRIVSSYIQLYIQKLQPYLQQRSPLSPTTPKDTKTSIIQQEYRHERYDIKNQNNHTNRRSTTTTTTTTNTNNNNDTLIQYNTDVPVLYNGLYDMNTFIQQHLHYGFVSNLNNNNNRNTSSSSSLSSSSCGGFSNGINGIIQDVIMSPQKPFITIPKLHIPPISFTISSYRIIMYIHDPIRLSGPALYNIQTLDILRPIITSSTTDFNTTTTTTNITNDTYFHNEIELLSELTVDMNVTICISDNNNNNIQNSNIDTSSIPSLNETFSLQMNFHQFHMGFHLNMELKQYYVKHIVTLSMIRTVFNEWYSTHQLNTNTTQINCFLQGINQISVHELFAWIRFTNITIQPVTSPGSSSTAPLNSEQQKQPHTRNSNMTDDNEENQDSLEDDVDRMIDALLDVVIVDYNDLISTAIFGYIQVNDTVQNSINSFIQKHVRPVPTNSSLVNNCTIWNHTDIATKAFQIFDEKPFSVKVSDNPSHWYNFHKMGFLRDLNTYLNHTATIDRLNQYIDCTTNTFTENFHQKYIIPNNNNDIIQNMTKSNLQLRDFYIHEIGQFQQIQVLQPSGDGLQVLNSFLWKQTNNGTHEVEQSLEYEKLSQPHIFLGLQLYYIPLNIASNINVTVLLNDIQWGIETVVHFDEQQFQQMTLGQFFSSIYCLFASTNSTEFNLHSAGRHLKYFQLLINTSTTIYDTNETVDVVFDTNDFFDIQKFASFAYEWGFDIFRDIAQSRSKSFLEDSANICFGESFDSDSHSNRSDHATNASYEKPMLLILLALFLFLQPTILFMKHASRSTEDVEYSRDEMSEPLLQNPATESSTVVFPENDEMHVENDDTATQGQTPKCFMMDMNIPILVQFGIPVSIIVTIVLLLFSNLSTGATVDGLITNVYEQQNIQMPSFFEFGLYNTARDMLKARLYPLFFLVLIFSGMWPYMKLFLMLLAWIGPTSMINPTFRGHLLLKLDALSKYSLVDTYVLIVMMVAFRFQLPLLENSSLNINVEPQFGFFGFLLATTLSLLIGHVMVFYHRQVEILKSNISYSVVTDDTHTVPIEVESTNYETSLGYHSYHLGDGTKRKLSKELHYVLLVLLLVLVLLLSIGISQKCFLFEFGGLAGLVLKDNRFSYSVLSFAAAIPKNNTELPASLCIIILQYVFIFYTMIMPFASIAFLMIIWIVPMSWPNQYCMLVMAEISNAWSGLEVFCLSIVVALFEIETFANFMIGHKCDLVDQILKKFHGAIVAETCYSVSASVLRNALYLIVGAILYSVLVSFVLHLSQVAVHERLLEADFEPNQSILFPRHTFLHRCAVSWWGSWMLEKRVVDTILTVNNHNNELNNEADLDIRNVSTIRESDVDFLPVLSDETPTTPMDGEIL